MRGLQPGGGSLYPILSGREAKTIADPASPPRSSRSGCWPTVSRWSTHPNQQWGEDTGGCLRIGIYVSLASASSSLSGVVSKTAAVVKKILLIRYSALAFAYKAAIWGKSAAVTERIDVVILEFLWWI